MGHEFLSQKVTSARVAEWLRKALPCNADGAELSDVLRAIQESEHRIPSDATWWRFYAHRVPVKSMVWVANRRHELLNELRSTPGNPYLVSDATVPGYRSLTLVVALETMQDLEGWLRAQTRLRAVVSSDGELFFAAIPVYTLAAEV